MKKVLMFLTLLAFTAGPMCSMAQAAERSKSSLAKPKATLVKSKAKAKVRIKTKKISQSASGKATAQASKKGITASRTQVAPRVEPPLRTVRGVSADTPLGEELDLRASAAMVVDQESGAALYAKNIDVPTSIASITKLMTAMVTLDAGLPLDEEIIINDEDVDHLKGTGSRLALGAQLTREELLHLALIASENRAAAALSRAYPGGRPAFVAAMNRKASKIGMHDSRFVDATGLNSDNRATAADLVKMVDAAYRYPLIREISTTGRYDVSLPGTQVVKVRENGKLHKVYRPVQRHVAFNNTNRLTRSEDWDIGVSKTGYINEAGHCLVMQTRIADQRVIIVLLDSIGNRGRIADAQRIRKWLGNDSPLAIRKISGSST
ncbi:MAG: Peptidase protein [Thermodesulfobacteriota bacterium]|nr:Peptidase protein [Thermodesulfobacteriota bacterium]